MLKDTVLTVLLCVGMCLKVDLVISKLKVDLVISSIISKVVLVFATTHMVSAGNKIDYGSISSLRRLPLSVIKMKQPIFAEHQVGPSATASVPHHP